MLRFADTEVPKTNFVNLAFSVHYIPYNGNDSWKKTFTNFATLGAFVKIFLQNFSYNLKSFFRVSFDVAFI